MSRQVFEIEDPITDWTTRCVESDDRHLQIEFEVPHADRRRQLRIIRSPVMGADTAYAIGRAMVHWSREKR